MEPKGLMVIKDPEIAKLFSDPVRRQILHLVTHKEMSASDLVKELDKNYSSIVYHIKQLVDAGLIVKVREEVVQKKIQDFYRATAWSFHVSYYLDETMSSDKEYARWQEDLYDSLLKGMDGYHLDIPRGEEQRVRELLRDLYLAQKLEFEGRIELRKTDVMLEPYIGKTLGHILEHLRLFRDEKVRKAAEELTKILNI